MIEINYVPNYMKINHIFFVIKGQFPVTDYIPNTIILYFIVHCIYVLSIFYCITCLCWGAQWLNGRVLDSRPKSRGFEPHRRHCVVVLEQDTFILA